MTTFSKTLFTIIILAIVAGFIYYEIEAPELTVDTTTPPTQEEVIPTPVTTVETTSDGTISFARPEGFALAVNKDQMTAQAYIPPCDPDFRYCLFYNGTAYKGTNFESAGIALRTRPDLKTQTTCLTSNPEGYQNMIPKVASTSLYSISLFAPLGDAGAGHYANGEEYRVFANKGCYQFDLRIGQTQFANYPAGTIKEFTSTQQTALLSTLRGVVRSIKLVATGESLVLPK